MSEPSASAVAHAARLLAERRRSGQPGPRLPAACRPTDLDEALAVQAAVTAELDEAIGGWKCGTPSPGKVVVAPIHLGTIERHAPCVAFARNVDGRVQVKLEPELAFVLGRDLPPRKAPYTPAEVDAAIAHTHLALELIDNRFDDGAEVSFEEKLADGLVNQGLWLGPEVDGERARHAAALTLTVAVAGQAPQRLDGRHPNPAPREPLYWLAEFLRQRGVGLRAGQPVITGSYAGSFWLPVDADSSIEYADANGLLGALKVRFKTR
jgi:2-keto-4-pentenoate hydratase